MRRLFWSVSIHWTGPLDWTTGLTFDLRINSAQTARSMNYCQLHVVSQSSETNMLTAIHFLYSLGYVQMWARWMHAKTKFNEDGVQTKNSLPVLVYTTEAIHIKDLIACFRP